MYKSAGRGIPLWMATSVLGNDQVGVHVGHLVSSWIPRSDGQWVTVAGVTESSLSGPLHPSKMLRTRSFHVLQSSTNVSE